MKFAVADNTVNCPCLNEPVMHHVVMDSLLSTEGSASSLVSTDSAGIIYIAVINIIQHPIIVAIQLLQFNLTISFSSLFFFCSILKMKKIFIFFKGQNSCLRDLD